MLIVMQRQTSLVLSVVNDKYAFCRGFAAGGHRAYVSPVRHIAVLLHCIICRRFRKIAKRVLKFYVLLTVQHLDVILVNDQLEALFFIVFISTPLHVSSSKCSSSGGPACINTPPGITHSIG